MRNIAVDKALHKSRDPSKRPRQDAFCAAPREVRKQRIFLESLGAFHVKLVNIGRAIVRIDTIPDDRSIDELGEGKKTQGSIPPMAPPGTFLDRFVSPLHEPEKRKQFPHFW
jgi:hypothetical protein